MTDRWTDIGHIKHFCVSQFLRKIQQLVIFGHVTSLIGRNVTAAYSNKFPRLLHTPAKFEKNPPDGHRVIRKMKRGA